MILHNDFFTCAISFLASLKLNLKDVFMGEGFHGSVPKLQMPGGDSTSSSGGGYLRGLLNGVPTYDTCASPDGPIPASKPGDAPFSQGRLSYEKSIHCPRGIHNQTRGVVLLVPCTSCEASEVFSKTPLGVRLPKAGFDVCWINLPFRGLGDMQLSGEFVAYAIDHLSGKSPTGKIDVITYSQGGSNAQWAVTFWPSVQAQIINLVTIAAPHKGTMMTGLICPVLNLIGGCLTSVLQMTPTSRYMNALYSRVNGTGEKEALVSTTSIYTYADEIVYPQLSQSQGASYLSGASNIALQDVCGKGYVVEHFGMLIDMATYGLVYDALTHGRPARTDSFDSQYCKYYSKNLLEFVRYIPLDFRSVWKTLFGGVLQRAGMIKILLTTWRVTSEPLLMQYVCKAGYSTQSSCTPVGFCRNISTEPLLHKLSITSRKRLTGLKLA
ncbi:hypothetical protein CROQUDRAFT_67362 [Cronartium quercuum f. sp. fusiforme G11]|uniref:Lipase n=1 Tax=Cronartium quercuum f. sp. fusiforme G11 TaxID=708437 RepID=A0A9P6T896_9BASI|nr:hypothetical protein CROQUDRAFT_67362 [Cronartium quercuum f. sp. fusiforme G11]